MWRARVETDWPAAPRTPYFSVPGNAATETDLRTKPNTIPVIAALADTSVVALQTMSRQPMFTDPDDATLSWSALLLPAGASLDAATGLVQWTPQLVDVGSTEKFSLRGCDTYGACDTVSFKVTVLAPTAAGENAQALRFSLSAPAPNPSSGDVALALTVPGGGMVRARVLSADGRTVATLLDGWRPAGATVLRWDGRTSAGTRAPRGIYLIRASMGGEARTQRIVRRGD